MAEKQEAKAVNTSGRPTVSTVQQTQEEILQRLEVLEQAVQGKANKLTFPDFKFFFVSNVQKLLMVALILYGSYALINSDFIKNIFNGSSQTVVDPSNVNLSGSIEDVSRRYAPLLDSDTTGLRHALDDLSETIDSAYNPTNELIPLIQHEVPVWRDSVGTVFRRE